METKNELKTLEEANYREIHETCENCTYSALQDEYTRTCSCVKFKRVTFLNGVCDCYE